MGNCSSRADFFEHFGFLIPEIYRVLMPGREVAVHCMNLPDTIERQGHIGIYDFRGDIIRAFQKHGFIFHAEVCIWKDPLLAAVRTKALGLAHKQIVKDSAMCRPGIPDYLCVFRKPGINPIPVPHEHGFTKDVFIGEDAPKEIGMKKSHNTWRRYASPIWMDIRQSRVLKVAAAREEKDEKHICPLQLDVIDRGLTLWSNPGEIVFSPFAGIGSEGYCAVLAGRKFLGFELKDAYAAVAGRNLSQAEKEYSEIDSRLFEG